MAIFHRDGSKNWYASWCHNSKERVRSLGTANLKKAIRTAQDLDDKIVENSQTQLVDKPETLQEATKFYLTYLDSENRASTTLLRYTSELKGFIAFCADHKVIKINQLSQRVLDLYRAERKGKCAETTRHHESMVIIQFGKYLVRSHIIEKPPFTSHYMRKPSPIEQSWYTIEQVERILELAPEQERNIFEVLAFTGIRLGELIHLTWKDILWDRHFISIRAKEGWEPKNHKPRLIPMHVRVEKVLNNLPRCHTWVFTARESSKYPSGDHKINGNHLREKLKRILKKLELKGCLHSFRHCFASYCANKGVPPMQLLSWLGHSSLGMVKKYYHLGEDESLRSMRGMCQDES